MDTQWDEFNKRYPDTDYQAKSNASEWKSDMEYLAAHMNRVNMKCKRFTVAIAPNAFSLSHVVREVYSICRQIESTEKALERAFRVYDITWDIIKKLKSDLSDANISEWLSWKQVVAWYGGGVELWIPRSGLTDDEVQLIWAAVDAADKKQSRCPECNAVTLRKATNNLGQTVYRCNTFMCCSQFTSDVDN